MSDFSLLRHKDRSKLFYANVDDEGRDYLAYQIRGDPIQTEHFVLYFDEYDLSVTVNDFGQDVLVYTGDDDDKYIDFDNIELFDGILTMRTNGEDDTYETITFDLNEEEEEADYDYDYDNKGNDEEDEYDYDYDNKGTEEEEDEYDYEGNDDEEEEIRTNKVNLTNNEPEVFRPNLPVKRYSFAPGAVNLMSSAPPQVKIKSSTKQNAYSSAKINKRVVDLTSSVTPSVHFTYSYHQDRLFNRPITSSSTQLSVQEYKYKSPPRTRRHKSYKNGTGNHYVKTLNKYPYDIELNDYEPEWLRSSRQYDYWKHKQVVSDSNRSFI